MSDAGAWLLYLHILAAFWLVGGAFGSTVARAQARRAASVAERAAAFRIARRMTNVFTIPGWILVALLGVGAMHPRGWSFSFGWIQVSLVLWAVFLGLSLFVVRPWLGRVVAACEASVASGKPTAELEKALSATALRILAEFDALGVVVITLMMVFKPF